MFVRSEPAVTSLTDPWFFLFDRLRFLISRTMAIIIIASDKQATATARARVTGASIIACALIWLSLIVDGVVTVSEVCVADVKLLLVAYSIGFVIDVKLVVVTYSIGFVVDVKSLVAFSEEFVVGVKSLFEKH